jgi:hypothetical protein
MYFWEEHSYPTSQILFSLTWNLDVKMEYSYKWKNNVVIRIISKLVIDYYYILIK